MFADLPANTSILEITKDFNYKADESGNRLWKKLTDLYKAISYEEAAQTRKKMPANENHYSFAIVHNGVKKIMSAMTCTFEDDTKTMSLEQIATHYAYQRKGLASILIEHLKKRCKELDVERIEVEPLQHLHEFYASRGFKSYDLYDHSRTFEVSNDQELPSGILEYFVNGEAGRKKWQNDFEEVRGYFDEHEGRLVYLESSIEIYVLLTQTNTSTKFGISKAISNNFSFIHVTYLLVCKSF